jgi:vacuolar-type H+-ATPase subunit D/Vma8
MYDNTGLYVQINRLKTTIDGLQRKINQLDKELCPECKKKFQEIFKET